ncbi:arsenical pump membrane protein-domain-containing protein [Entophlyctis helioformis]|nr:arsenical pump membrane protein-domain-containing protein [Entophlyctis helioformis]
MPKAWRRTPAQPVAVALDIVTAPILGVLLLWASTAIGWRQIVDGIVGSDPEFKPYSIVILVFALAYISISLDLTGVFTASAVWAAQRSGSSGARLFLALYLLSSIVTVVASNDVVVLTLTPILCYFAKALQVDPVPMLIAVFHAANTWSSVLIIGNPTNLIVGQKYGLGFIDYTAWMIVPGLLSSLTSLAILFVLFRRRIPAAIKPISSDVRAMDAIQDKPGAIIGSIVMVLCLATLAVTSLWKVPVWMATLPFSLVMLVRDIVSGHYAAQRSAQPAPRSRGVGETGGLQRSHPDALADTDASGVIAMVPLDSMEGGIDGSLAALAYSRANPWHNHTSEDVDIGEDVEGGTGQTGAAADKRSSSEFLAAAAAGSGGEFKLPTAPWMRAAYGASPRAYQALARMPWKIGPFVVCMFIMVEGLKHVGWVDRIAAGLAQAVSGSLPNTIFLVGFLSAYGCCLLNNQPLSIFFANILTHPSFSGAVSATTLRGGMFALILGSNFGGNLMLHAALAGLMWDGLLRFHGIRIGFWQFSTYGLVVPAVLVVGCLALWAELVLENSGG